MTVFPRSQLITIEAALVRLNYADAKVIDALVEVRSRVDMVCELSNANQQTCLGEGWQFRQNPATGLPYTYVDEWEMRYELIRREIVRKLQMGCTIKMLPPLTDRAEADG